MAYFSGKRWKEQAFPMRSQSITYEHGSSMIKEFLFVDRNGSSPNMIFVSQQNRETNRL